VGMEDQAGQPGPDEIFLGDGCGAPIELKPFFSLLISMTSALHVLHRQGIVHRKLNPNVFIVNPGSGTVRLIEPQGGRDADVEAFSGRNLAYLAPEQSGRMNRPVDCRADLYSLGVISYQMLTGRLPFEADDFLGWMHCQMARSPKPPERVNPGIPSLLSDLVLKLVAKLPEDRYQSVLGLQRDLIQCQQQWEALGTISPFILGKYDISDRFQISKKLYGREAELAVLQDVLENMGASGRPAVAMVSGHSGVGKSSLVYELQKIIAQKGGFFLSGKFDPSERDILYAVLRQALLGLIQQMLCDNEEESARWKARLSLALGQSTDLLIQIIPQMRLILGEPSPLSPLPPVEAKTRLHWVLSQFIAVFACEEHPMVVFLDDLQWADEENFAPFAEMIADPRMRYVMLVGAYRENEVDASHPVAKLIEMLGKTVIPRTISLGPLGVSAVRQWVADTMGCESASTEALADLILEKTGGNPFFASRFLDAVHAEGLVWFDAGRGAWCFDVEGVREAKVGGDILELVAGQIERLGPRSSEALEVAAHLGSQFDLGTLALVMDRPALEVSVLLEPALQKGLLLGVPAPSERVLASLPVSGPNPIFRFAHDRVRQAASRICAEESGVLHLMIGRRLLAWMTEENRGELLFAIVSHLNAGAVGIEDREERLALCRLNLEAGDRAKNAAAYALARSFFSSGVALLPEGSWDSDYQTAFSLHREYAQCESIIGTPREAERLFGEALERARGIVDRAEILALRVVFHVCRGAFQEGIRTGLEALQLLGFEIAGGPSEWHASARGELEAMQERLVRLEMASVIESPLGRDPRAKTAMAILAHLMPAAHQTNSDLFALFVVKLMDLSLRYGHTGDSVKVFADFGIARIRMFGDYASSHEYGALSLRLADRLQMPRWRAPVLLLLGFFLSCWSKPLRTSIAYMREGHRVALDGRDLPYAGRNLTYVCLYEYHQGTPLDKVNLDLNELHDFLVGVPLDQSVQLEALLRQTIRALQGKTRSLCDLGDNQFNERLFEQTVRDRPMLGNNYHLIKLQLAFLQRDLEEAWKEAVLFEGVHDSTLVSYHRAVYCFYGALLCCAMQAVGRREEQELRRSLLQEHFARLEGWASGAPENFINKYELVAAERARIDGKLQEAMDRYDQAIEASRRGGFHQEEALANELAGRFYLEHKREKVAKVYLTEAHAGFLRWGASAVAAGFRRRYATLFSCSAPVAAAQGRGPTLEQLDFLALLKASQAISSQIVPDQLLDTLMRVVLEQIGAQNGALFLARAERIALAAEALVEGEKVTVWLYPGEGDPKFPVSESILNYVRHSRERVLLSNASESNPFSADPCLRRRRPKSLLCLPILRLGKLAGILYLENNLIPNAFTEDRLDALELLGAQAAISLESAGLYAKLQAENSERREAERLLQKEREYLKVVLDSVSDGIVACDARGVLTVWNRAIQQFHGLPAEPIPQQKWSEYYRLYRPDGQRTLRTEEVPLVRALKGEIVQDQELLIISRQGKPLTVLTNGRALINSEGEKLGAVIAVRDITERKAAEEALRRAEERYRSIIENAVEGIFQSTEDGRLLMVNPAYASMFGFNSPEEMVNAIGDLTEYYVDPRQRTEFKRLLDEQGVVKAFEAKVYRRDRSVIWISSHARAVRDAGGVLQYYEGTVEDISRRKELEEQFLQAQKMEAIGQLAGGIAHDFNNILTVINGFSSILLEGGKLDPETTKLLKQVYVAGERAANLTRQLLAFSRKQVIQSRILNMNDLIQDVSKMLHRIIGEDVVLRLELGEDVPPIQGDEGMMSQILMNLAVNSRDAMSKGGTLTLSTERVKIADCELAGHPGGRPGDFVRVSVRDTGSGIAPGAMPHIFEPFFTTKEVGKGTGLGLATVFGIVRQHQGWLEVDSEPGVGTAFHVYVPTGSRAQSREMGQADGAKSKGGSETVLVVEDEPFVRELAALVLRQHGYRVLQAGSGAEAEALWEEAAPTISLLLTDLVMPGGMTGLELAERLRREKPGLKILFASGYQPSIWEGTADPRRMGPIVQKPYAPHVLAKAVRRALDAPAGPDLSLDSGG